MTEYNGFTEKIKREIKERDGGCKRCGYNYSLVIHHIDGDKNNQKKDNLICLCYNCHAKIHSSPRPYIYKNQLKRLVNQTKLLWRKKNQKKMADQRN